MEEVEVEATELEVLELEAIEELVEELLLPEPPPALSPALNITIFADLPEGTVTTQKPAPPAPSELSEEVTWFELSVEGSILQGRPMQPASSSQVISTPKLAGVLRHGVEGCCAIGL